MAQSRKTAVAFLALVLAVQGGAATALPFFDGKPSRVPFLKQDKSDFVDIDYAVWTDEEPDYRLFPGDELEITVPSAPELNRTVKVQPDGRIAMPLITPLMAADKPVVELEHLLSQAYSTTLRRPEVEVALKQAGPVRIFVGGEVGTPGVYEMPGDIDALQAVIMAGGFRTSARGREVVVVRRNGAGRPMMRTVNLSRALDVADAERVPLRRFDIVYVPRGRLSEVGVFLSQIRDALPFTFSYNIGDPYQ
jgi:polysaccharide export outer membrane protein